MTDIFGIHAHKYHKPNTKYTFDTGQTYTAHLTISPAFGDHHSVYPPRVLLGAGSEEFCSS